MDINRYLGKPWVKGEYDCWGLVRDVYKQELGIVIPVVLVDSSNMFAIRSQFKDSHIYSTFKRLEKPVNLAVATMKREGGKSVMHCGIWYEGRILNNRRGSGVIFEPADRYTVEGYFSYVKTQNA